LHGDAVPELLQRHGIQGVPNLMLAHQGREIGRQAGTMPLPRLVAWAREHAHGVNV
jgi:thioredoxin 2